MKRSLTKNLKRRIAQSTDAIYENVIREHSQRLSDITAVKLNTFFKRAAFALVVFTVLAIVCSFLTSCNVTRTITNESQYFQRGDTSVVISTKTIETYDATKKL